MLFASLRVIMQFQTHSAAVLVSELDSGASISILHFAIPARASCAGMTPTAGKLATTATVSIASSRLRVPEGRSLGRIPVLLGLLSARSKPLSECRHLGGNLCFGIYCTLQAFWAGVALTVGTLAPRHLFQGRGPWTMCRSDASPKCRRDSRASVSSVRMEASGAGRTLSFVLAAL